MGWEKQGPLRALGMFCCDPMQWLELGSLALHHCHTANPAQHMATIDTAFPMHQVRQNKMQELRLGSDSGPVTWLLF